MKNKEINHSEYSRHLNNLSVCPDWNTTVDKTMAKALLESDFVFCNGLIRYIRSKHLGCGVYRIYTEAQS
jgi:hypothetical protein